MGFLVLLVGETVILMILPVRSYASRNVTLSTFCRIPASCAHIEGTIRVHKWHTEISRPKRKVTRQNAVSKTRVWGMGQFTIHQVLSIQKRLLLQNPRHVILRALEEIEAVKVGFQPKLMDLNQTGVSIYKIPHRYLQQATI